MALTTYTELKASLADWLHRSDLTSQIADFVTLAESEINTELRLRLMEADEALTLTSATRTVALPSRYIEPISLELVISGQSNQELTYRQPQQLAINAAAGSTARPEYWTVNGSNIEFPNLSDATYTLKFRMLKGLDLTATSTNAMLSAYPGLYLYGSLLQAAPYMVNDARIQTWKAMYESLKAKISRKEARSKTLARLVTDLPSVRAQSNIITG